MFNRITHADLCSKNKIQTTQLLFIYDNTPCGGPDGIGKKHWVYYNMPFFCGILHVKSKQTICSSSLAKFCVNSC